MFRFLQGRMREGVQIYTHQNLLNLTFWWLNQPPDLASKYSKHGSLDDSLHYCVTQLSLKSSSPPPPPPDPSRKKKKKIMKKLFKTHILNTHSQIKVKVVVYSPDIYDYARSTDFTFSWQLRWAPMQPAIIDPTLDLCTRYPLRLGGPRQYGMWSLPDTSNHDQCWESNPRPSVLNSNALST